MQNENELLQCYNRGCGQKFDPLNNPNDSCRHHPGLPVFHDAYKGWSCCSKKCTDFTEFLNIKGCTVSSHSNIKPPEPEKRQEHYDKEVEIVEIKPIIRTQQRPSIDTPMVTIKPEITLSLQQSLENMKTFEEKLISNSNEILIGTACQNSGCMAQFEGSQSNDDECTYHSGSPIFHEGMKYWSCCQRKTTDFDVFLNQVGCQIGKHKWVKEGSGTELVDCRWDWHQTAHHVVVSIYAKEYCPDLSIIQLNPIRIFTNLVFSAKGNATFTLDIELQKFFLGN
ncbi:hypothetical protein FQA39_LY02396 [Lamprigera yunnana]|nr:hypothetical protein FQA39_LY02396 [Lamprigera yunnana]